jgi:hypothetical protein
VATGLERGPEERKWLLEQLDAQQSGIFERLRLHVLGVVPDEAERRTAALANPDILFSRERLGEAYRLLPVAFAESRPRPPGFPPPSSSRAPSRSKLGRTSGVSGYSPRLSRTSTLRCVVGCKRCAIDVDRSIGLASPA